MKENGEMEDMSSTIQGITSYDAPYVSGNNYQGSYTDSASFGSSSSAVTSGAPLEDVAVQVSSSGSADGIAGSGYSSSESTGLAAGSNGLAAGSNGFSTGSNGFSAGSNGNSAGSNGFSAGSNGILADRFSAGSNGLSGGSNGYVGGSESAGFAGSSSNGFANGGQGGGINLIQGQSQSFDLTGGSNGGQRVVYKPVIKQGEPIITKNFYVVSYFD